MNKPIFNFPEEGCFMGRNEDVENYLKTNKHHSSGNKIKDYESIGIAWNEDSYWYFKIKSGKKVYTYEQLLDDGNVKSQQFEVGKWYKSFNSNGSAVYLKFQKLLLVEGLRPIDNYNKIFGEIYWFDRWVTEMCNTDVEKNFKLLTDLAEIQQYLPDGHVDKKSVIPEYVECLQNSTDVTLGKIYKVISFVGKQLHIKDNVSTNRWLVEDINNNITFKPSTKQAFDKQNGIMDKEQLIAEAKRRYPVGTVFKCACDDTEWDSAVGEFNIDLDNDISIDSDFDAAYVYYQGKWAEIISKPTEEKWIPKVGDWVFTDMYNTSGFKEDCVQVVFVDELSSNQPDFKIKNKDNQEIWCYPANNNTSFVRKALPHEIPNNTVKAYTAEEALVEIQKLGLEVGDEIYVRKGNGVILGIETVTQLPNMFSNCHRTIIRCSFNSDSELWHSDYPELIADSSIIHKKAKPKYKENTVGYWLDKLNEPERSLALGYAEKNVNELSEDLRDALVTGFIWENTKEGHKAWSEIRHKVYLGNYFSFQKEALAKGIEAHEQFDIKIGKKQFIDGWEFIARPKSENRGLYVGELLPEFYNEVESNNNSTVDSILEILDKYYQPQAIVKEEAISLQLLKPKSLI